MGRGLSELQEKLLLIAYRHRTEHMDPDYFEKAKLEHEKMVIISAKVGVRYDSNYQRDVDVRIGDILLELYNFKPRYKNVRTSGEHIFKVKGDPEFEKKYHAVHSSLSRAISRLERRGYIHVMVGNLSHWTGFNITDTGIEYLQDQGLTVKSSAKLDMI